MTSTACIEISSRPTASRRLRHASLVLLGVAVLVMLAATIVALRPSAPPAVDGLRCGYACRIGYASPSSTAETGQRTDAQPASTRSWCEDDCRLLPPTWCEDDCRLLPPTWCEEDCRPALPTWCEDECRPALPSRQLLPRTP